MDTGRGWKSRNTHRSRQGFTEKDRLYVVRETERKVGQGNLDINTIIVSIDKLIYTRRGKFKLIVRK